MKITEKHIAAAEKLEACRPALKWLREKPRTLKELAAYRDDWAAWIVKYAPDAWAERAWSALMSRPGGPSEASLRYIAIHALAFADKANAELARREARDG